MGVLLHNLGIADGDAPPHIRQMFSTTQNPLVCFGAEYLMILLARNSAFTNSVAIPFAAAGPAGPAGPAVPADEDPDVQVDLMRNLFLTEAFNNKDSSTEYIQGQKLATSISKLFFEQEQEQFKYKMNHFNDWCSKFADQRLQSVKTLLQTLRDQTGKNQQLTTTTLRSLESATRSIQSQLTENASAQESQLHALRAHSQKQAETNIELFDLAQERTEKLNAQATKLKELLNINKQRTAMLSDTLQTTLGNSMPDLLEVHGSMLTFPQQAMDEDDAFEPEHLLRRSEYIIDTLEP